MRLEGQCLAGGSFIQGHVPLPTTPRPNGQRPRRPPVIVLQPLTRSQERALERRSEQQAYKRPGPRGDLVGPAEAQRLADAYLAGQTVAQIQAETGRAAKTIRAHIIARGVTLRPPVKATKPDKPDQRQLPPEESQRIADLYRSGVTVTEIQRRTGHSKDSVYRHIRWHGIDLRRQASKPLTVSAAERELIIAAYERLGSVHKVGRALHRHDSLIRDVLDTAGLTRTKRGRFEPITDAERARIRHLAAEGLTNVAIAARVGRGRTVVGDIVRNA
jgi:transposase-like protein